MTFGVSRTVGIMYHNVMHQIVNKLFSLILRLWFIPNEYLMRIT